MTSNDLSPARRPAGSLLPIIGGVVVVMAAVWLVMTVVVGLMAALLGFVVPLGLVVGGGFLLANDHPRAGAAALAVGLLMIVF